MRHVPFIDATGTHRLKEIIHQFKHLGIVIILSGVKPSVKSELEKSKIYTVLDKENLLENIAGAVERAKALLSE